MHIFRNRVEVIPMFSFSRNGTFGKIMPRNNEKNYSKTYSVYDTNLIAQIFVASRRARAKLVKCRNIKMLGELGTRCKKSSPTLKDESLCSFACVFTM